jgi:hypothetical protein
MGRRMRKVDIGVYSGDLGVGASGVDDPISITQRL